jgi:effector-binding domain-containing protein
MAEDFIEIAVHNAFVAEVKTGNKERQKKFLISITPDSLNVFDSRVTLIYKTSYITKLFGNKDLENQAIASLENLKSYTENTSALYGFEINKALVTDPLFLFSTRQVDSINRQASTEELFKSLIEQANKKALGYTGVRIFHSQPEPNGKIMLFAGIGISVQFESKENDPMRFKGMPRGKNLIVATYEGPYKNIGKAYEALEEYMKDRSLTSMAMPFEKFISDGVGFADTQIVKINVTHPVY